MPGGTKNPPIKYTDDAIIVSPKDWNDLVDIFLIMKDKLSNCEIRIEILEGQANGVVNPPSC